MTSKILVNGLPLEFCTSTFTRISNILHIKYNSQVKFFKTNFFYIKILSLNIIFVYVDLFTFRCVGMKI